MQALQKRKRSPKHIGKEKKISPKLLKAKKEGCKKKDKNN